MFARALLASVTILCGAKGLIAQVLPQNSRYTLATEAQAGNVKSQCRLGIAYAEGEFGFFNFERAEKWLRAAAANDESDAVAELGELYIEGKVQSGLDVDQGIRMIRAAADRKSPLGLRLLGQLNEQGVHVPLSYKNAFTYYLQAMAEGDRRSVDLLGTMYFYGRGVPVSKRRALNYWRAGASQSEPWSQYHLAVQLEQQQATAQNADKEHVIPYAALPLYEASAKHGNLLAAFRLGELYESGTLAPRDTATAEKYYAHAAVRGYSKATLALARLEEASGNPSRAIAFYLHARKQGQLLTVSQKMALKGLDPAGIPDLSALIAPYFNRGDGRNQ